VKTGEGGQRGPAQPVGQGESVSPAGTDPRRCAEGEGHGVHAMGGHQIQEHHIALSDLPARDPGGTGGDPAHGQYRRDVPEHPGQRYVAVRRGLHQRGRRRTCLHQQPDAVGGGVQSGFVRVSCRQLRHQPGHRLVSGRVRTPEVDPGHHGHRLRDFPGLRHPQGLGEGSHHPHPDLPFRTRLRCPA